MTELTRNWDDLASQILVLAGTYWVHSTLLLGAAIVMNGLFRIKNQALVERIWKFAAVAPLVTALLAVFIGLAIPGNNFQWLARFEGSDHAQVRPQDAAAREQVVPNDDWRMTIRIRSANAPDAGASRNRSATMNASDRLQSLRSSSTGPIIANPPIDFAEELARSTNAGGRRFASFTCMVIVVIAIAGVCRIVFQVCRLGYELSRCQHVQEWQQTRFERLCGQLAIRKRIILLTSSSRAEPVACGWLRWRIVIPERCNERLTEREWTALLTHEIAHLARGDTWWLLIGGLLCNCLPFQPLNFAARKRWTSAAEFLSDEWAVSRTADPLSLATCLTQIAEWRIASKHIYCALVSSATGSSLVPRVERLVAEKWKTKRSSLPYSVALVCTSAACFTALAAISPLTPGDSPTESSSAAVPMSVAPAAVADIPPATNSADELSAQLAQIEADLARCEALASESGDEEVQMLAALLSDRIRLLKQATSSYSLWIGFDR